MAFVNDPLFLVVAEVTLSYIRPRTRRGGRIKNYLLRTRRLRDDIVRFIAFYLSLFPIPWNGKAPAGRFHFNRILI